MGGGRGMADVGCSLGSEAGDAGSLPCTRSQVKVDYFINLYTSMFIRLSHLYQECHAHFIVIRNDGQMGEVPGWLTENRMEVGGQ